MRVIDGHGTAVGPRPSSVDPDSGALIGQLAEVENRREPAERAAPRELAERKRSLVNDAPEERGTGSKGKPKGANCCSAELPLGREPRVRSAAGATTEQGSWREEGARREKKETVLP